MRQQLSTHTSLSRGALYWLIFCSSFCASSQEDSLLRGNERSVRPQRDAARNACLPVVRWNLQVLRADALQRLEAQGEHLARGERVVSGARRGVQP